MTQPITASGGAGETAMSDSARPVPDIYGNTRPRELDAEGEAKKRGIYECLGARGKKFVDKIGYEKWDPFQEPKEPLDIRTDVTKRTTQQLVRRFLQERAPEGAGNLYGQGVLECALGLVNKDEKIRGIFEFCIWYEQLLRREGHGGTDESPL